MIDVIELKIGSIISWCDFLWRVDIVWVSGAVIQCVGYPHDIDIHSCQGALMRYNHPIFEHGSIYACPKHGALLS